MRTASAISVFSCVVSLALLSGCDSPKSDAAASFSTKDSAGVRLVDNGGTGGKPATLLNATETLRIGGGDDNSAAEKFHNVNAIAIDDSGRLYVGDGSNQVRVFGVDGKRIRAVGRTGRGPGEFQLIGSLFVRADTLAVSDQMTGRLARFDGSGRLIDETRTQEDRSIIMPIGQSATGWVTAFHTFREDRREGLVADTFTMRHVPNLRDAFAMAATWDTATSPTPPVRVAGQPVYHFRNGYSERPLWGAQPSVAADAAGNMYATDGMHYRIDTYDAQGRLTRRVTRAHTPVKITKEMVDRYFARVQAFYDSTNAPQITETDPDGNAVTAPTEMNRKSIPRGEAMPALARMLVSRDGAIWVQRPDLVEDPAQLEWDGAGRPDMYWDVFDPDGRWRGTVKIPKNFSSRAVTRDAIIGVSRDADDVESVVVYTISADAPAAR